MHPAYMMQRFLFRCKVRTFSVNNKKKIAYFIIICYFLRRKRCQKVQISFRKRYKCFIFLTYIKKERFFVQKSQKMYPNTTRKSYLCTVNKSQ